MDKHRICKICYKRFANGKAMGGHMRSHLAKLPIPPKPQPLPPVTPPKSPSSTSSLSNPSSKNHMQCYRSINRELGCRLSKPDLDIHDRESETESRRNPTRRRSKRSRRLVEQVVKSPPVLEPESVSSVTETFSDEDVAMCLVMLSRDKWPREGKEVEKEVVEVDDDSVEEEEDEDDSFFVTPVQTKSPAKYRCETCNKVFRSYQALGGHRASHKNKKIKIEPEEEEEEGSGSGTGSGGGDVVPVVLTVGIIDQRIFACPFCDKVFESGQGLGGHKKVHFSYLAVPKNPGKSGDTLLDLNLPAPEDDCEVYYQVEHSAVSNASMSRPRM